MSAISWAVFDLDGTLTPTCVLSHIGERAGFKCEASELTNHYESGRLTNDSVSRQFARHLETWPRHKLIGLLEDLPITPGLDGAVERLREAGIRCMISTATFDFAAAYFCREYGFDGFYASELHYDEWGMCIGSVHRVRDAAEKRDDLAAFCDFYGIPSENVAYVGDGASDIDALRWARHSIAFNPTPRVVKSAAARCTIRSNSLTPAVNRIVEWAGRESLNAAESLRPTEHLDADEYPPHFFPRRSASGWHREEAVPAYHKTEEIASHLSPINTQEVPKAAVAAVDSSDPFNLHAVGGAAVDNTLPALPLGEGLNLA